MTTQLCIGQYQAHNAVLRQSVLHRSRTTTSMLTAGKKQPRDDKHAQNATYGQTEKPMPERIATPGFWANDAQLPPWCESGAEVLKASATVWLRSSRTREGTDHVKRLRHKCTAAEEKKTICLRAPSLETFIKPPRSSESDRNISTSP